MLAKDTQSGGSNYAVTPITVLGVIEMIETVDILIAARALIKCAWTKKALQRTDFYPAQYCAAGAIRHAATNRDMLRSWELRDAAEDELRKYLPPHYREYKYGIARFNDAETTTKQDILNLFDKAIADLGGMA